METFATDHNMSQLFSEPFINALFGLIVGTLFGHWLERTLYRPKVLIEFGRESRYKQEEGKYVSIVIKNKGNTAAIDAVGTITLIDVGDEDILDTKEISGEFLPVDNYVFSERDQLITKGDRRDIETEKLCWAHIKNPYKLTINPGAKSLLDVYKAIKKEDTEEWYIVIPTEAGWEKQRIRVKDGSYKGCLMVSAVNSPPRRSEFRFNPSSTNPSKDYSGPWIELYKTPWYAVFLSGFVISTIG